MATTHPLFPMAMSMSRSTSSGGDSRRNLVDLIDLDDEDRNDNTTSTAATAGRSGIKKQKITTVRGRGGTTATSSNTTRGVVVTGGSGRTYADDRLIPQDEDEEDEEGEELAQNRGDGNERDGDGMEKGGEEEDGEGGNQDREKNQDQGAEEDEDEQNEEEEEEGEEDDDEDDVDNFSTSEIVTVFVGPKRKKFFLHRELICQRSPFMEKCLKKGRFDEGYKNELYLPEDDPKAFSIIVDWIYRTKLPSRTEPQFDVSDLSAAYCMADKFGMEELQNSIMDTIRLSFGSRIREAVSAAGIIGGNSSAPAVIPNFGALALTHLTGPHKSPLKRFYVEHLVFHMMKNPKWYHELKRNDPARIDMEELFKLPDLVFYIMKKVWQYTVEPWKDPALWDKCCYHVHSNNTACAARVSTLAGGGVGVKAAGSISAASRHHHHHHHQQQQPASTMAGSSTLPHLRTSHGGWPATMGVWNNPGAPGW
ncbi:hypothetical protein ABEF95_007647 [Exophiala dermatitidis]